ncbi:hypothetical protein B0A50_00513 [Salinomyces thailandicus]|uniref:Uncharacterized protein n=1 Tax=Salinomyces thailandicus TaxID=706561 RepID=A0A4U0UEI1_9PEZI|nr:hypothetical protein B0A50_00513 [Salinomyces thailandica]
MPDIDHFSDSSESFHSFDDDEPSPPASPLPHHQETPPAPGPGLQENKDSPSDTAPTSLSPATEASLLAESQTLKTAGNAQFKQTAFSDAIQTYDRALAICPQTLNYDLAVLRSNIAACHLKLAEWKEAVTSADKALEALEKLAPLPAPPSPKKKNNKKKNKQPTSAGKDALEASDSDPEDPSSQQIEEVTPTLELQMANLSASCHTLDQLRTLQLKLLTRRATASTAQKTWSTLQAAQQDYKTLLQPSLSVFLSSAERARLTRAASELEPQVRAAQEREMAEMMGQLRGLGDKVLRPFGLSTGDFGFEKDEGSGGYKLNFQQGGKGRG